MRYRFADYELNTQKKVLTKSGVEQKLTSQVYLLLEVLITHKDEILSKQDLIDKVWDGRHVSPKSIDSQIRSARAAIGDSGSEQIYIKTFNNRGISFIAPVEEISDEPFTTPSEKEREAEEVRTSKALIPIMAGMLILVFCLITVFFFNTRSGQPTKGDGLVTGEEQTQPYSILFLPFETFDDQEETQALAKSIFLELKSNFESSNALNMISMSQVTGSNVDSERLKAFVDEFDIDYIVSGYVIRDDNLHKTTFELSDPNTDKVIWTQTLDLIYDPEYDSVPRKLTAHRASISIFEALGLERPESTVIYNNPDAYALFLEGRQFTQIGTAETFDKAVSFYERALEVDKNFVPAHTALAMGYVFGMESYGLDSTVYSEKVKYHLQIARSLDPESASVLQAEGTYARFNSENELGLEYYERAIAAAPNRVVLYYMRASTLYDLGRVDEAEKAYEDALKFDPAEPIVLYNLALIKSDLGKINEAFTLSERNYRWNALHPAAIEIKGLSHYWRGEIGESIKYFLSGLKESPEDNYIQFDLVIAQAMLGNIDGLDTYMTYPAWKALFYAYKGDMAPAKSYLAGSGHQFDRMMALGYMTQDYDLVYDQARKITEESRYNDINRQVGFTDVVYLVPLIEIYRAKQNPDTEILMELLSRVYSGADEGVFTPEAYVGAIALSCFEGNIEEALRLLRKAEQAGIPMLRIEREPPFVDLVNHPDYPEIRKKMVARAQAMIAELPLDE